MIKNLKHFSKGTWAPMIRILGGGLRIHHHSGMLLERQASMSIATGLPLAMFAHLFY
jgi:hypothetical protein